MKEEREAMANLAADLDRVILAVDQEEEGGSDEEFEFAVVAAEAEDYSGAADEIFANGRILPVYPVFNRDLLESDPDAERPSVRRILVADRVDRSGSASSSSSAESDAAAAEPAEGSYCVWAPPSRSAPQSPERWKKSSSTGSSGTRGWRLRDLVVGRSRSDGKERFHFMGGADKGTAKGAAEENKKGKGANKKDKEKKEMDMVTAHRLLYGKGAAPAAKGGRRSFLPYRQVGLFYGAGNEHGL